jgi:hypothetical protein
MAGQRWVRLDVDYFSNPKALAAGRDGRDLHLASICWVGRYLTDGYIPAAAIADISHAAGVPNRHVHHGIERAVFAGLWVPNGDGFELHDFVAMNGTRADVERERDAWRARQRRARARQGGHGETEA